MNCEQFEIEISAQAGPSGELSSDVAAHVASCAKCEQHFNSVSSVIRDAAVVVLPTDFKKLENLAQQTIQKATQRANAIATFKRVTALAIAASFGALVVAGALSVEASHTKEAPMVTVRNVTEDVSGYEVPLFEDVEAAAPVDAQDGDEVSQYEIAWSDSQLTETL